MTFSGPPRLPFFLHTLVRCLRRSTSSGRSDFLGDEFVMSSSTAHGKVFFAIAAFACFQETQSGGPRIPRVEFWALFLWARVSGIHLFPQSLAFTCLSSRSTLRSLWTVLRLRALRFHGRHQRLALLPGLRLSGRCTRARARPHVHKGPWSFYDRGEMAHPR